MTEREVRDEERKGMGRRERRKLTSGASVVGTGTAWAKPHSSRADSLDELDWQGASRKQSHFSPDPSSPFCQPISLPRVKFYACFIAFSFTFRK
jgi:hypothetical protein